MEPTAVILASLARAESIPMAPTAGQYAWVVAVAVLLGAALALAVPGFLLRSQPLRRAGRWVALAAALIDFGLVVYRNLVWKRNCPIENNYDSVVLFAAMLGGLLFYLALMSVRGRREAEGEPGARPRRSAVDLILLPLMIVTQCVAIVIYFGGFRQFKFTGAWRPLHLGTLIVGTLFLAAAAIGAVMYLLLDRTLRSKRSEGLLGGLPSLERLETLIRHAVSLGFLLLTVGMLTGVVVYLRAPRADQLLMSFKVHLAAVAWLVYLVLIAVEFMPRWRGRRIAWLSVLGFGLLLATYLATQLARTK